MERRPRSGPRSRTDTGRAVDHEQVGDILGALEDEDCRALLCAADGEALSAGELADACDLPLSTTYRKVDTLAEVGLLEERLRLRSSGKHTSEYALRVDSVNISLSADGVEVRVSGDGETAERDQHGQVLAEAD